MSDLVCTRCNCCNCRNCRNYYQLDADGTVDNPMGDTGRLATGFSYAVDDSLDLHMSYTLVWLGDMDVQQTKSRSGGTVSGGYSAAACILLVA